MVKAVCVLRSGGVYGPQYVYKLRAAIKRFNPELDFLCLSDVPLECEWKRLEYDWPRWWCKLEMFGPRFGSEDILTIDLDTVITGSLDDFISRKETVMLSDFNRLNEPASGIMFLRQSERKRVWDKFISDPWSNMTRFWQRGDQSFIGHVLGESVARWQDQVPGQIISYKKHYLKGEVTSDTKVICFHGNPRPHEVNWLET